VHFPQGLDETSIKKLRKLSLLSMPLCRIKSRANFTASIWTCSACRLQYLASPRSDLGGGVGKGIKQFKVIVVHCHFLSLFKIMLGDVAPVVPHFVGHLD